MENGSLLRSRRGGGGGSKTIQKDRDATLLFEIILFEKCF